MNYVYTYLLAFSYSEMCLVMTVIMNLEFLFDTALIPLNLYGVFRGCSCGLLNLNYGFTLGMSENDTQHYLLFVFANCMVIIMEHI